MQRIDRTGETKMMNCGLLATIIRYKTVKDIDVKLENGLVFEHQRIREFNKGTIGTRAIISSSRIGETNMSKNGLIMTIIEYRKWDDIDIKFEDGVIIKNVIYSNFKKGEVKHPFYSGKKFTINKIASRKVGEINYTKQGYKLEIVAYRGCKDIDVKVNDSFVLYKKNYTSFKKGTLKFEDAYLHPRVGEVVMSKCGLKTKIICYRSCEDIEVEFEDGVIVKIHSYDMFKKGIVGHPKLYQSHGNWYSLDYFGFKISTAFVNKDVFYNVYKEDNFIAIMKLNEIYKLGGVM